MTMENRAELITRNKEINPEVFWDINVGFIERMNETMSKKVKLTEETLIKNSDEWIPFIESIFDSTISAMDADSMDNFILWFGSFIGETLLKIYGGNWKWDDVQQRWVVSVKNKKDENENIEINVFNKVEKRIKNGQEDSVVYWYESAKNLIIGDSSWLDK